MKGGDKVSEGGVIADPRSGRRERRRAREGRRAAQRRARPRRAAGAVPRAAPPRRDAAAPSLRARARAAAPRRNGRKADIECQLLVLGAGPGGYTAAFRAADLGMALLVER